MTLYEDKAGELVRCLLMLSQCPGRSSSQVRKPPRGLSGWAARAEERMAQKLFPQFQINSHIRGKSVGQDYLLEALVGNSTSMQLCFVAQEAERKEMEKWIANVHWKKKAPEPLFYSTVEFVRSGLDRISPDIWLDLTGQPAFALRMRDQLSSQVPPVVSVQHGISPHTSLFDVFLRLMLTPTYPCDSLICTSKSSQKALTNILGRISSLFNQQFGTKISFEGRIDIVPLGINTDVFRPQNRKRLRKQLGIPQTSYVLLYLGYLSLFKTDISPLLPMVRRLVDSNPKLDLRLVIAGTGPESYSRSLLSVVRDLNLSKIVSIRRDISDDLKQQLLGAADVFVGSCESFNESFGLAPVEAMACGLPQVVADWNGYRETVAHGETGFLVPTCWGRYDGELFGTGDIFGSIYDHTLLSQSVSVDIGSMQESLQILISRPELKEEMSRNSRVRAETEFSYMKLAMRYDQLLRELHSTARALQRCPKSKRFDHTAYFDYFGHFATRVLTDEDRIHAVQEESVPVSTVLRIVYTELGVPVFDEALLENILKSVSNNNRSEHLTMRELISIATGECHTPDEVRRHIHFLLKHGKLGVV